MSERASARLIYPARISIVRGFTARIINLTHYRVRDLGATSRSGGYERRTNRDDAETLLRRLRDSLRIHSRIISRVIRRFTFRSRSLILYLRSIHVTPIRTSHVCTVDLRGLHVYVISDENRDSHVTERHEYTSENPRALKDGNWISRGSRLSSRACFLTISVRPRIHADENHATSESCAAKTRQVYTRRRSSCARRRCFCNPHAAPTSFSSVSPRRNKTPRQGAWLRTKYIRNIPPSRQESVVSSSQNLRPAPSARPTLWRSSSPREI